MPQYPYHCRDCRADFNIFTSMSDKRENVNCEECNSNNVFRVFARILTKSGGFAKDTGAAPAPAYSSSGGGCSSCSATSCGTCD